jgi:tellurite resistance protein
MVCLADGRISPLEERHFLSFIEHDPVLRHAPSRAVRAGWVSTLKLLGKTKDFSAPALAIATLATSADDRETVMRAAQAALVADQEDKPNENGAIRALALALKLDPEKY